jgi:hypothetical protein
MPFGRKSKLGVTRPTKKVKIDDPVAATVVSDVAADLVLPHYLDYLEYDDEFSSFEFVTDNDESVDDPQDYCEFLEERSEPLLKQDCFRQAVAFLFVTEYNTIDNKNNAWSGRNGIRKKIRVRLGLRKGAPIDHILNDVLACKKAGISYNGERRVGDAKVLGQPPIFTDQAKPTRSG